MAARLSRLLTATTVFLLVALLVLMIVDGLTAANLGPWSNAVIWALAVLILIRLLTRAGSWRSTIAGPLAGSASVQSRMFGFTPGSSPIEHSSGPAYTISEIENDENHRCGRDGGNL
ncbi:hypothetical protein H9639_13820 [Arthrobacter sp. Sa2CUA1]|uniref:Uncharacterized protein n=1 Tax=Arthrobacter gallicola TaxID=2762225 RepID=A0ABR8UV28_9MICC|nr:hypothetical protein [Arthrobacter gallicola]MBD7996378.1 hypothetical protein [Arthrobacter gallicola]